MWERVVFLAVRGAGSCHLLLYPNRISHWKAISDDACGFRTAWMVREWGRSMGSPDNCLRAGDRDNESAGSRSDNCLPEEYLRTVLSGRPELKCSRNRLFKGTSNKKNLNDVQPDECDLWLKHLAVLVRRKNFWKRETTNIWSQQAIQSNSFCFLCDITRACGQKPEMLEKLQFFSL